MEMNFFTANLEGLVFLSFSLMVTWTTHFALGFSVPSLLLPKNAPTFCSVGLHSMQMCRISMLTAMMKYELLQRNPLPVNIIS